jgi:hypothetical protein
VQGVAWVDHQDDVELPRIDTAVQALADAAIGWVRHRLTDVIELDDPTHLVDRETERPGLAVSVERDAVRRHMALPCRSLSTRLRVASRERLMFADGCDKEHR